MKPTTTLMLLIAGLTATGCASTAPAWSFARDCGKQTCRTESECLKRGDHLLSTGRTSEAACCFAKTLNLVPCQVDAELGMGIALSLLGQRAEAVPHFQRVIDTAVDEAYRENAHSWLGLHANPLPLAVFYTEAEGCPRGDVVNFSPLPARDLQEYFEEFGVVRPVPRWEAVVEDEEWTQYAVDSGARVAVVTATKCTVKEKDLQSAGFSVAGYEAHVLITANIYSVDSRRSRGVVTKSGSSTSPLSAMVALTVAANRATEALHAPVTQLLLRSSSP